MHNILEKLFSIIIAPVRNRGGSVVNEKIRNLYLELIGSASGSTGKNDDI
jgi:hypothetical protein